MILFVPIHLDALSLEIDQPVLNAKADFTRLTYSDKGRDVNGDVAYISEEIVSEPFQDQGLYLKVGIHLHDTGWIRLANVCYPVMIYAENRAPQSVEMNGGRQFTAKNAGENVSERTKSKEKGLL